MIDSKHIHELLDDGEVGEVLDTVTIEEIAAAYSRYGTRTMATDEHIEWDDDPDGWAPRLYSMWSWGGWEPEDEERLRTFLRLIAEVAENDDVLGFIGAGPFEDFLCEDESRLAWVEQAAADSPKFRQALANVWIWSWASEATFLRIEAAAGAELAWPDHYGPRPGHRELSLPTPEEAAVAWFLPHQTRATPVATRIDGDNARVWLLTKEVPSYWISHEGGPRMRWDGQNLTSDPVAFEEYEAVCECVGGLWRRTSGHTGFSAETPADVRAQAEAIKRAAA